MTAGNEPHRSPEIAILSQLAAVQFHQSYHAGQLGVLRRIAGKDGAIP
jgi:hypothetical protein